MSTSIEEKRKSLLNFQNEILEGRVIANYGDPGLDNDSHQDILSRFVVVAISSEYRVPTANKWQDLIAIVARPESLWISCSEGKAASPSSQSRQDFLGNVSIGLAGNFSTNGIGRINQPYQLGELIKFKKIFSPITVSTDTSSFFLSVFPDNTDESLTYATYHTEGSTLSYFAGTDRIPYLREQNIYQIDTNLPLKYGMVLNKYQYEAFMLSLAVTNQQMYQYLTALFASNISSSDAVYQGHGGYVFKNTFSIPFLAVSYEDINVGQKERIVTSECIPLIVSTPSTFPTPKVRTLSTINYNPSYSNIIQS